MKLKKTRPAFIAGIALAIGILAVPAAAQAATMNYDKTVTYNGSTVQHDTWMSHTAANGGTITLKLDSHANNNCGGHIRVGMRREGQSAQYTNTELFQTGTQKTFITSSGQAQLPTGRYAANSRSAGNAGCANPPASVRWTGTFNY